MKRSVLFIDESGKPSLIEKANEPFLLTGVILEEKDIKTVEGFFDYIKRKYKIDNTLPFHSFHLLENPKTKLHDNKNKDLLKTIADFIAIIPIKIHIVSIDKEMFKKTLGVKSDEDFKGSSERKELKESPYKIMSAELFKWFAKHLKKNGGIGEIIVDARRGGDYQLVKTLYLCKDPNGPLLEEVRKLIQNKCTALCFAEKGYLSGGLEITDLISYTSYHHARRAMSSMDNIKLSYVWGKIRAILNKKRLHKLSEAEIKEFFKIGADGIHKDLKKSLRAL